MPNADDDFGGPSWGLDPISGLILGGPTFTIYADLSKPVELPPGVDWAGPAPVFGVDYGGGPEDAGPPADFDARPQPVEPPLPSEPPPSSPPALPPLEGEVIPGEKPQPAAPPPGVVIEGEAERYPSWDEIKRRKKPKPLRNTPDRRFDFPSEPIWPPSPKTTPRLPEPNLDPGAFGELDVEKIIARGIGRIVLGPIGNVIGDIAVPTPLDSGELPFPRVPPVEIPPPRVELPEPMPRELTPEVPQLGRPETPDVVVVEAPTPQPVPRSRMTRPRAPKIGARRALWPLLLGSLAPMLRRPARGKPAQNVAQLAPFAPPEPATPPDPLTPPSSDKVPLPRPEPEPQPGGTQFAPTQPQTSECRCQKCKKCRQRRRRKQKLSDKTAHMDYTRRLSVYSLRNLQRGGIQQHLRRLRK